MPNKYLDLVKAREERIREVVENLSKETKGFEKPKLVLIGGYGLRAFVPFSRSTRDCDFALAKGKAWSIDKVQKWVPDLSVAINEKRKGYGFLRCLKLFRVGKQEAKISLDFMEGKVVSRSEKQVVDINPYFLNSSLKRKIPIGSGFVDAYVPSYAHYLLLKIVSARQSDIRDIAALVWKNGIPADLENQASKILPYPEILQKNLKEIILPEIKSKQFLHSWRGMFVTTDFTEQRKEEVVELLKELR